MLGLKLATDPRWVNLASLSIEEILTDHAFCEQKATTNCISLIQLYPERAFLVDKLIPIVNEEDRFLDRLLLAALIEARSCERFRLLSLDISDDDLKHFYHKLMISEATHYRLFIDIAEKYFEKDAVKVRWQEWLDYETKVLGELELRGDRIH